MTFPTEVSTIGVHGFTVVDASSAARGAAVRGEGHQQDVEPRSGASNRNRQTLWPPR